MKEINCLTGCRQPLLLAVKAPGFSGAFRPAQTLSAASTVAAAAETVVKKVSSQAAVSPVSGSSKNILARLIQHFRNPEKIALWSPALMHMPATTIQPFLTYFQLSRSGVDPEQVNTLTKMETVRSLTSHGLNLIGSILPAIATEIYNQRLDMIQKLFRMPNLKKASTLQQFGFIILMNTLTYGVFRPMFINAMAAKTFLRNNPSRQKTPPPTVASTFKAPVLSRLSTPYIAPVPLASPRWPAYAGQASFGMQTAVPYASPFSVPASMPASAPPMLLSSTAISGLR
ncbi:MAG: hypothetical protein VKK59_07585 [Vampirovibrionales bacterium]|nr:hypothetical protein [Vampirovibrionales bacterium]